MQVKEIDINTGKIKGYGICKKKYKISLLGGPTTPTYSTIMMSRNTFPEPQPDSAFYPSLSDKHSY